MKHLVVNASPLILLGKIGRLALLETLADALTIPNQVAEELLAGPADDPARRWLKDREAIHGRGADPDLDPRVMAWGLGSGETAVISIVIRNPGMVAVLDDRAARKCASVFGIDVIGTAGLLLQAKTHGLIGAVMPELEKLEQEGSFLDPTLKKEILLLAREKS